MTELGLMTRYQMDLSTDENGVTPMPAPMSTATWMGDGAGTQAPAATPGGLGGSEHVVYAVRFAHPPPHEPQS